MNRDTISMLDKVRSTGITLDDAIALRRISMTLRRWFELECGTGNQYYSWHVERDEKTGNTYFVIDGQKRQPTPDREAGARKRLDAIMARYPALSYYVQTDPRGASLYILRPGDVPEGKKADSYYSRGIAVYK